MHHDRTRKCHNAQISQLSLIASFSHFSSHVAIFAFRRPISIYSRNKLTQVLFPLLHHMSGWLFHHSRRSQPEDSDGAGEEEEEKKIPFYLFNLFFPLFGMVHGFSFYASLPSSISSTSGSYSVGQTEIETETSES